MAEETTIESVADAPVESIADDAPVEASEQAQDAQEGAGAEQTAQVSDSTSGSQQDAEKQAEVDDYKLEAGEDFNIPSENLDSFTQACKDAKLSRTQAEAMLAWHKAFAGDVSKAQAQAQSQQIKAWQNEILGDQEFGGAHWKATVADSRKALAQFDPSGELRQLLKSMNADYHPAVVRAIARVGRAMGEDKIISSQSSGSGRDSRPLEDRMWPDMNRKLAL